MRAIIYCRVSTDGQERDGTGLQTQEDECRRCAAEREPRNDKDLSSSGATHTAPQLS